MERKLRFVWWFVLIGLVILAIWKLFLPHGSNAYLQKSDASREIVVYVAGAVEKPGLVHLAPDARLDDALKQVRPLQEANLESMNPAEKLKDGQKISVPYKALTSTPGSAVGGNQPNVTSGGNGANNGLTNGAGTAGATSAKNGNASQALAGEKIDINTAGAVDLDKLSGVGPALAQRIVQYRTEHGPFTRPEDLENVSGIGPKVFEKMASQVTVDP